MLLFISPLYSFVLSREPLPAYMLAAVAFAVHACKKIRKGKLDLFTSRLNTALFILPLLALFSSIAAWETRGAVGLFLLLSSCFAAYWLTSSLTGFAAARGLLLVMTAGGAAASILMLTPIAQGNIADEALYSLGALLAASYLCCTCIMSYYETMPNQPYLTTNPTTLINPTLFTAGYFLLMSVIALGSVLTYTVILLGLALLLYGLTPAMRKNALGILLIQGASVFLVIRPVQESLAAGSGISGWLWAGAGLLLSAAMLDTWHRLKKYAEPNPGKKPYPDKAPHPSNVLYTIHEPHISKDPYTNKEPDKELHRRGTEERQTQGNPRHFGNNGSAREFDNRTAPQGNLRLPWSHFGNAGSAGNFENRTTPQGNPQGPPQEKPPKRATRRLRPWVIPAAAVLLFLLILISGSQNIPLLTKQTAGLQPYPLAELLLRSRDALKAMATSPGTLLLGAGGGGWPALSHLHQSFYYEAPVPGAFLQAGVELGIFGLLAFCAAWGIFINKMKQLFKTSRLSPHSIAPSITGSANQFNPHSTIRSTTGITNRLKAHSITPHSITPFITGSSAEPSSEQKAVSTSHTGCLKPSISRLSSEQKAVITATAAGALALGCHFIIWCGFSPAASLYLFAFFGLENCLSSCLAPLSHAKRAKTVHISFNFRRPQSLRWLELIPWPEFIRRPALLRRLKFTRRPKLRLPKLRLPRPPLLRLPKLQSSQRWLPKIRLPKVIITGTCLPKITPKAFSKINIGAYLPKITLSKRRPHFKLFGQTVSLCSLLRLPSAWAKAKAAANSRGLATNTAANTATKTASYLAVLAAAALIFTLSWGILMGERAARTAEHALEKGDIMAALHNMEKAARRDPFNSTYHKQLGMLYLEKSQNALPKSRTSTGDAGQSSSGVFPETLNGEGKGGSDEQEYLKKAVFHFQRGLRLSWGDVELRVLYAEALLQMGEVEEGAAQLKEAVKLRPLQQNLYEYLALGCLTAGRFLLEQAQTPEKASQETIDKTQQKTVTIIPDKTQPENPERDPQKTLTATLDKNLKESLNEPTVMTQQKTLETTSQKTLGTTSQQTKKTSPETTSQQTFNEPLAKTLQTAPSNAALLTKARSYLKAALQVPEELEKRRARINKKHLIYWRGSPYLGITPKIRLYSGEAAALLGDWPQAVHYLNEAARDASLRPEALLWQGLVLKRTGRGQEGETLISRALQEKPELAAELNKLEELLFG